MAENNNICEINLLLFPIEIFFIIFSSLTKVRKILRLKIGLITKSQ